MNVVHKILLDCSAMPAAECSDTFLAALEHGPAFKLKADLPSDTVHGSITVDHNSPPEAHEIIVEVYESDVAPVEGRESSLKRPAVIPTSNILRTRLERLESPDRVA